MNSIGRNNIRRVDKVTVDREIKHFTQKTPGTPYQSIVNFKRNSGLAEYYLRSLLKEGKLPGFYVGVKYMVDVIRFEEYLDTLSNGVTVYGKE